MFKKFKFIAALVCANLISIAAMADQAETAYTTYSRYDSRGLLLGTISAKTPTGYLATRNTYDAAGKLIYVEKGTLKDWQNDSVLPEAWVNFTLISAQRTGYDEYARKTTEAVYDKSGNPLSLVQMNYGADGNVLCKAVRMNPDAYNNLPDACTLSTKGPNGYDRISRFVYNFRDQIETEKRALNTGKEQTYITNTYESIYLKTQTDANNNKTTLYYDSDARLERMEFPVTTKGWRESNPADYVQFTYDNNGNKITERKRNGDTITYMYDANNRLAVKDYASNTTIKDQCYVYDNRGLQLEAHFGNSLTPSVCISGVGLSNTYDGRGNILTATTNQSGTAQTIVYSYDLNSNRETIKHPDNVSFKYAFDGMNRVTGVANVGSADNSLLAVNYGASGKRSSITRNGAAGAITEFKFDNGVQLNEFSQKLGSVADNLTNTFKYNAASQVIRLTESNRSYSYIGNDDRAGDYTPDGLNRYERAPSQSIGVVPFDYDKNSNLINDGSAIYTYDSENHLLSATKNSKVSMLEYDPNGRLFQYTSADGVKHQYLYDNNALVLEYINGVVDKRYVHGDQVDEPWIVYNGAGSSSANLSYLHTNHQGSIIAHTNASGQVTNKLAYDAYGIPASLNMGTFGYTGQVYLKELGLYYYKARIYHPQLGRFMQTDPIGYKDDYNLYAYAGNDPINRIDSTGKWGMIPSNWSQQQQMYGYGVPGVLLGPQTAPFTDVSGAVSSIATVGAGICFVACQPAVPALLYISGSAGVASAATSDNPGKELAKELVTKGVEKKLDGLGEAVKAIGDLTEQSAKNVDSGVSIVADSTTTLITDAMDEKSESNDTKTSSLPTPSVCERTTGACR